jgi:hypothetical protein
MKPHPPVTKTFLRVIPSPFRESIQTEIFGLARLKNNINRPAEKATRSFISCVQ